MGKRKKEHPLIEGLRIEALAAEGKAMGHHDGVVVFVPSAVPGDVVDVRVRSKRRRFMEGSVVRWVERSGLRAEPFCEHFGVCGGCSWQNLPYEEQLKFKQRQVADQLVRIGRLELPVEGIRPILGSEPTTFYRNKLEFTFAPRRWRTLEEMQNQESGVKSQESRVMSHESANATQKLRGVEKPAALPLDGLITHDSLLLTHNSSLITPALGFHIPGMFDKILDIRECWLQPEPSNAIRLDIKRFCVEHGYEFYNVRTHEGLMRNVVIRTASTGETMVIVVFARPDCERIGALMEHLKTTFPEITSLMYMVNTKLNDSLGDQQAQLYSGRDHIFEQMEGLRFKIGPKSFYQTNSAQAYELYKIVREMAGLTVGRKGEGDTSDHSPVVYDLYTGTGTIANFVAGGAKKVVGIEYVAEAIEDARENSVLNGIACTAFFAGDMRKVLTDEFVATNGRPDVVILDPPRAGVDAPVVEVILRAMPQVIVYVSCNPATQARDLALMSEAYEIVAVQPGDMFPHTHHVENVVKLIRK